MNAFPSPEHNNEAVLAAIHSSAGTLCTRGSHWYRRPPGDLAVFSTFARLRPDGRVDGSFGPGGKVITSVGRGSGANALIQQPDGTLVVASFHSVDTISAHLNMLLVRYLPNGRVDSAFGVGGLVITDVGGGETGKELVQQPDGKLVAAGTFSTSNTTGILLARYQALGCPTADPGPCLAQLEDFVTDVYRAALARQPDAGEVDYWVDVFASEPTLDTVRGMLHAVFDGPEFRQRPLNPWQYVEALYLAMLGREPASAEIDLGVQAVLDRVNTLLPAFLDSPTSP